MAALPIGFVTLLLVLRPEHLQPLVADQRGWVLIGVAVVPVQCWAASGCGEQSDWRFRVVWLRPTRRRSLAAVSVAVALLPLLLTLGMDWARAALLAVAAGFAVTLWPGYRAARDRRSRQFEVTREFPETVDLLCICVEAGNGFPGGAGPRHRTHSGNPVLRSGAG